MYRSNNSIVKKALRRHILEYFRDLEYDGVDDKDNAGKLVSQIDYMDGSNVWNKGIQLVTGGCFLIYDGDIIDFLDSLNLKNKSYLKDPLDYYSKLIGREVKWIYNAYRKLQCTNLLELIQEVGYIPIKTINNLDSTINTLEGLGYDCYLDASTDNLIID